MNFMEEINKETQAMLKQISIRKAEKKANANKRIAELKKLIKFWEQDLWETLMTQIKWPKNKKFYGALMKLFI